MDTWKIYSQALEQFKAENYDAALKILDDLKRLAPGYQKAYCATCSTVKSCCA